MKIGKKWKKWRKKTFFCAAILTIFKQKCSYLRPLLSITFPQGFWISKNIGHPTSESGGKKTIKRYLKSEQTDGHTDTRTHGHTDTRTFWLIESIGPEGRCFKKKYYLFPYTTHTNYTFCHFKSFRPLKNLPTFMPFCWDSLKCSKRRIQHDKIL